MRTNQHIYLKGTHYVTRFQAFIFSNQIYWQHCPKSNEQSPHQKKNVTMKPKQVCKYFAPFISFLAWKSSLASKIFHTSEEKVHSSFFYGVDNFWLWYENVSSLLNPTKTPQTQDMCVTPSPRDICTRTTSPRDICILYSY